MSTLLLKLITLDIEPAAVMEVINDNVSQNAINDLEVLISDVEEDEDDDEGSGEEDDEKIAIPPPPFTKEDLPGQALGRSMFQWVKKCFSKHFYCSME